ncbi:MAG: aspartate aminotransferase family protein [Rhodospirillales bacterium]|jgi:glutamate-1-semialdehyde 2,1-aminomutase|nr:aspartate aminotransferase family protein [Rhodospirillales bacterium]
MNSPLSPDQRALEAFPAGIANGEYGLPPEEIVVMEKGQGCRLWSTEGAEFLDMSMGWGSVLVGHANPNVVAAVQAQAPNGSNFAYLNSQSLALAEEIRSISPASERLRFCASGTEATMYCQRLARAFTGREKILKFEGAYHGANEAGVTSLFASGKVNFPTPELTSAGTPAAARQLLVAPYNDIDALRSILSEYKDETAAILMEPLQRCTPPREGYLQAVRAAADEFGVLLIFDEVVTGFRLAYGGAQEYYGVVPDMVAYGKALGGGYPIGAFGGRADIMEMVNEHRIGGDDYVWMASTLGGNPISTAAANAALGVFRSEGTYNRLHGMGQQLREKMGAKLSDRGITGQIIGDGPLAQVVFSSDPVFDYRSTKKGDSEKGRAMMLALFRRRVFLNPMGTKLYLSVAHDDAAIDDLIERFDSALAEIH